ncbi:lytic transglycosylase domain-containing protein [Frigoribacterium sp. PvP032]|uniref:aggregation-promoting factor C-terminal-like domain-containing protein n=1 Tax=Frigoribacterium sp. PvP032 TaxID=2806589 RepID=UPI001B52C447|nr:lytic transglycosylase domain-containing protein [Frigoribacterium sp. PvP032]MBP1190396.1 hypothetical protein [Frigoribacterium sp. PvP032]
MGRHSANSTTGHSLSEQRLVVSRPRTIEKRRVPASLVARPAPRPVPRSQPSAGRRYVLPLMGFAATFAFLSASLVNPLSGAEAATTTTGGAAALVSPGQTFVVGANVVLAADRDQYGVTLPPPPPPPAPVVEQASSDEPAAPSTGSAKKSSSSGAAPVAGVPDPGTAKAIAAEMVAARGWGTGEYDCLVSLWNKESGWNINAHNASSGAHGIPQALPGSKMASAGADWQTNPATQITWGLGYIQGRYTTPCGAWGHSQSVGWY